MTDLLAPTPMSETDAVNLVLRAMGEDPITSINTATQADVVNIINILKDSLEEVLSMKWRFNTEFGYHLQPSGQLLWTGVNGVTELLNVFEQPSNMLTFENNPSVTQSGPSYVNAVPRRAQYFQDPIGSGAYPIVIYDRQKNREGWNAGAYPFLALDVVWFQSFLDIPSEAQRYVACHAARIAVENLVNSTELSNMAKTNEMFAMRHCRRQWGDLDNYNAFRNVRSFRFRGFRPAPNVGFIDNRGYAPSVPTAVQQAITVITVSPTSKSDSVAHGTQQTDSFTVTNTNAAGGLTGTYTAVVVADGVVVPFAIVSPAGPFKIAAQGAQVVKVTYTPAIAGSGAVTLTIVNGSQTELTVPITVTAS